VRVKAKKVVLRRVAVRGGTRGIRVRSSWPVRMMMRNRSGLGSRKELTKGRRP